jgi:hypothetical protein
MARCNMRITMLLRSRGPSWPKKRNIRFSADSAARITHGYALMDFYVRRRKKRKKRGSTAAAADWQGCGRRAARGLRVEASASHWRCGNGEDTQPALGCATKIRRRWAICTAVGETRHLHVGESLAQPGPHRRY